MSQFLSIPTQNQMKKNRRMRKRRMWRMKIRFISEPMEHFLLVFFTPAFFFINYSFTILSFTFQDKVGSWYSNPGAGTSESGGMGIGGVGKYLKARNAPESATVDNSTSVVGKKRKVGVASGEFKDFSAW